MMVKREWDWGIGGKRVRSVVGWLGEEGSKVLRRCSGSWDSGRL